MSSVIIAGRTVGAGHPPLVVAEAGINHNGEVARAIEMVRVASEAGCDAVKFQTYKAAEFVNDPSQMFTYRSQGQEVTESMLRMFQRYELPDAAWGQIKTECDRMGILFFSTPQNPSDLELLISTGVKVIKVGSDDFTNLPLLRTYARTGLPLILSSGMANLADVQHALDAVGALDGFPTVLLVCTSQYPTPPADAHLARISTLRAAFPMVPIGFSDHTEGALASAVAATLGACVIEKHFTLSRNLPGPDHWFSADPVELAEWVRNIRGAVSLMGSPLVRPTKTEMKSKGDFQRRIVAARDIKAGEILTEATCALRRVAGGEGLPPSALEYLVGRPAPRSYRAGEPLRI
jgi:N,N'-diacetyllegionaminate synthase